MNPYKLKDVFKYLTSNNQLLKKKLKLGTSEIPIPPKRQDVIDVEVINRFTKANPRVDTTNLQPLSVKQSKKPDMKAEGGRIGFYEGGDYNRSKMKELADAFARQKYGRTLTDLPDVKRFEMEDLAIKSLSKDIEKKADGGLAAMLGE